MNTKQKRSYRVPGNEDPIRAIDTHSDPGDGPEWKELDGEGFQQKVAELFEQYSDGQSLHRADLLDMLEDLGFTKITELELRAVIIQELNLAGAKRKNGGGVAEGGGGKTSVGYVKDYANATDNIKLPSFLDLEDVTAIAMYYYQIATQTKLENDSNRARTLDQEIEVHVYAWLILSGGRRKEVNYIVVRPKYLRLTITPRTSLIIGATVVLLIMCFLVILILSLLWQHNQRQDEHSYTIHTAERLHALLSAFESRNGMMLGLNAELGESIAKLVDLGAASTIAGDLGFYASVAQKAAYSAETLFKPHLTESNVIASSLASAGTLITALSSQRGRNLFYNNDYDLSSSNSSSAASGGGSALFDEFGDLDSATVDSVTQISPLAPKLLANVLAPMINSLRNAKASPNPPTLGNSLPSLPTASDLLRDWDFVIRNISSQTMIDEGVSDCAQLSQSLRSQGMIPLGADLCDFSSNPCANYVPFVLQEGTLSSATAASSTISADINAAKRLLTDYIGKPVVNLDGPIPMSTSSKASAFSSFSSGVVIGSSVSAHFPTLGVTVCFFKPLTSFREEIYKSIGTQYSYLLGNSHSDKFNLSTNIVRYNAAIDTLTPLKLPVETVQGLVALGSDVNISSSLFGEPCLSLSPSSYASLSLLPSSSFTSSSSSSSSGTLRNGCVANGVVKSLVRAVATRCMRSNATTSVNSTQLTNAVSGSSNSANAAKSECTSKPFVSDEGYDTSGSAVRCAVSSYGYPALTDVAIIVCRSSVRRDAEIVANLVESINTLNRAAHAQGVEFIVATRNTTTNAINPQATAFAYPADQCLGNCGRTTAVAAAGATAVLAKNQPFFSAVAPDYRLTPVAAYYSKLAALGRVGGFGTPSIFPNGSTVLFKTDNYNYYNSLQSTAPYASYTIAAIGTERDVLSYRQSILPAVIGLNKAINDKVEYLDVVPLTNQVYHSPMPRYNPSDPCGGGNTCIDRVGFGVVYRSDCVDCSPSGPLLISPHTTSEEVAFANPSYLGPRLFVPLEPQCSFPLDFEYLLKSYSAKTSTQTVLCGAIISATLEFDSSPPKGTDYMRPFDGPLLKSYSGKSFRDRSSYYTAFKIDKLDIGIVAHIYSKAREDTVMNNIVTAVLVSIALVVVGVLTFVFFSNNNLKTVEAEWTRYRREIAKQKAEFSKIVGDVVPPAYANLLFLPNSSIAERLNITVVFINVVAFQKLISEQAPEYIHDHISYAFYAINSVAKYYRMFKVKTFGDNFMIVGGVNRQLASRSAAIRKRHVELQDEVASDTFGGHGGHYENVDDDEDLCVSRCVEASAVVMQLFSYLFVHNPHSVGFLKKRIPTKAINDLGLLRIGITTGPTNLIMTRHDGFPYFLALSETAACAHKLQQQAKSSTISISSDIKKALVRAEKDHYYIFTQEKTVTHKKIVFGACSIQQANIPIPKQLLESLKVTRAPNRLFFNDEGNLGLVGQPLYSGGGNGTATMTATPSERGSFFRR